VNIDHGAIVLTAGTYSIREVKNNIFYSCHNWSGGYSDLSIGASGSSRSHNWYYDSGTQSETNIQNGTGNPFVNRTGKDYHLSAATNAGYTLSSPYNTDPDGNPRGGDGVWDRGAFEFGGVAPSPPKGLRIIP
jgi:hypothetical protein